MPTFFHYIAWTFNLVPAIGDRHKNLDVDGIKLAAEVGHLDVAVALRLYAAFFGASTGCNSFVGFAGYAFGSFYLVEYILAAAGDLSIGANLFTEFGQNHQQRSRKKAQCLLEQLTYYLIAEQGYNGM